MTLSQIVASTTAVADAGGQTWFASLEGLLPVIFKYVIPIGILMWIVGYFIYKRFH